MAKRVCDLCDLNFEYPCKYKRHLESASHKRFSKSLTVKGVEPTYGYAAETFTRRQESSSSADSDNEQTSLHTEDRVYQVG